MKNFLEAILKVESALLELESFCLDEPLKRETVTIREAYAQRRRALEELISISPIDLTKI